MPDFTGFAIGSFLFLMCLISVFVIGAPMFDQMAHEDLMKEVGTQFSESQAGLETVSEIEGYQEDTSTGENDLTSFVVDKLEDLPSNPSKGQYLGAATKMVGIVFGIFTRILFLRDIFPAGVMPDPFGMIFKMVFLVPFWISLIWIMVTMIRSFIPLTGSSAT